MIAPHDDPDRAHRDACEEVLHDLASACSARRGGSLQPLMRLSTERIGGCLRADRCYLLLLAEETRRLGCTHEWCAAGVRSRLHERQQLAIEDLPPLAAHLASGQASEILVLGPDQLLDSGLRDLADNAIQSLWLVPMIDDGRLRGLLALDDVHSETRWEAIDQRLLRAAAGLVKAALGYAELEQRLRFEALHDDLTGLANRHSFTETLRAELARTERYGTVSSLVLADIDHFKRINARVGHATGDAILVALAERLRSNIRRSDRLARWGSDELALLLPQTALAGAMRLAESLRARIEAHHFPGEHPVTLSLGVTAFGRGDSLEAVLRRVDQALYESKQRSRNR